MVMIQSLTAAMLNHLPLASSRTVKDAGRIERMERHTLMKSFMPTKVTVRMLPIKHSCFDRNVGIDPDSELFRVQQRVCEAETV